MKIPFAELLISVKIEEAANFSGNFMILAHGAGTGMDHPHLNELCLVFLSQGINVVRFNFPYRERGKSIPDKMPVLVDCYQKVIEWVKREYQPKRLFCGGHSMGGRVASMIAAGDQKPFDGLLLFSYPLHPPGKPEKLRVDHLKDIIMPVLCFNGTNDDFCSPELMNNQLKLLGKNWTMHWINEADHGLQVKKKSGKSRQTVLKEIQDVIQNWVSGLKFV